MVHEIEDFYGVYLLLCQNPKFKGRTYIGYTVDPNRRIKQHNTGCHAGGAYRTSGKGPWEMVLIIHGFPNDVSGLRFEWAWQNPGKSRRLRDVPAKTRKESAFQYRWRVVCYMLRTAPWCGLSLTVRWLKQDFQLDFLSGLEPPLHIPVVYGPVVRKQLNTSSSKKKTSGTALTSSQSVAASSSQGMCPTNTQINSTEPPVREVLGDCAVCHRCIQVESTTLNCLNPNCSIIAHIVCLAQHLLGNDASRLLPIEGRCPVCKINLLWGELVRYRKGCNRNLPQSDIQASTGGDGRLITIISESDESS